MIMTAKKKISGRNVGRGGVREKLQGERIRNVKMNVNSDDEIVCVILFHLISRISF